MLSAKPSPLSFELGGRSFRLKELSAYDQWELLRILGPGIPALSGLEFGLRTPDLNLWDIQTFLAPLFKLSDTEIGTVLKACESAAEERSGETWGPVLPGLRVSELTGLCMQVIGWHFGPLFAMDRPDYRPIASDLPAYTPVAMPSGKDWLYRPVIEGMFRGESLRDGTIRIEHIAEANDALDVKYENEARARKAADSAPPRR